MNRPGKLPNYVERVIALRQRVKSEKGAEEVVMTSDAYAALGPLQTDWGKFDNQDWDKGSWDNGGH